MKFNFDTLKNYYNTKPLFVPVYHKRLFNPAWISYVCSNSLSYTHSLLARDHRATYFLKSSVYVAFLRQQAKKMLRIRIDKTFT